MNPSVQELDRRVQETSSWVKPLTQEMGRVVVGQQGLVRSLIIGLLSNGHVLLEGVPGLAKTLIFPVFSSPLIFCQPILSAR
jgi:MoxR-like ATPase